MSREHPALLYVGDVERGRAFQNVVQPYGWQVFLPAHKLEALGMYVLYSPDVVIVNAVPRFDIAHDVYYQLRTVDAEPIIALADPKQGGMWFSARTPSIRTMSPDCCAEEVARVAGELMKLGMSPQLSR